MAKNILEQMAGNKAIANLAFRAIKKHIVENNVSMLTIYVDNKGDISAKEYNEPMVIIRESDYLKLINKNNGTV